MYYGLPRRADDPVTFGQTCCSAQVHQVIMVAGCARGSRLLCIFCDVLIGGSGTGVMEADDRQVTTVFTVQPSFGHRQSTNSVS